MAQVFGIDHKYIAVSAIAVSAGVSAYALYRQYVLTGSSANARSSTGCEAYESKKLLCEYLVFHYGSPEQVIPFSFGPKDSLDFPKKCAELCLKHYKPQEGVPSRALDIGCAVGRSAFELARGIDEVIGIDYSQSFIDAAIKLKADGQMNYDLTQEGDIFTSAAAKVPEDIDRNRVSFEQGDACALRTSLGHFGVVLAANLICRLHHPMEFLGRLTNLLPDRGSILVITAPYTWLREFTDKSLWLGGYTNERGQIITGFQTLQKQLCSHFDLVEEINMPFFIRETARKNQWTVAHATVWKRR